VGSRTYSVGALGCLTRRDVAAGLARVRYVLARIPSAAARRAPGANVPNMDPSFDPRLAEMVPGAVARAQSGVAWTMGLVRLAAAASWLGVSLALGWVWPPWQLAGYCAAGVAMLVAARRAPPVPAASVL